jgi:hypothetical protein
MTTTIALVLAVVGLIEGRIALLAAAAVLWLIARAPKPIPVIAASGSLQETSQFQITIPPEVFVVTPSPTIASLKTP